MIKNKRRPSPGKMNCTSWTSDHPRDLLYRYQNIYIPRYIWWLRATSMPSLSWETYQTYHKWDLITVTELRAEGRPWPTPTAMLLPNCHAPIAKISRQRFRDILHFVDNDPRRDRWERTVYNPTQNLAVDEAMIKFQGCDNFFTSVKLFEDLEKDGIQKRYTLAWRKGIALVCVLPLCVCVCPVCVPCVSLVCVCGACVCVCVRMYVCASCVCMCVCIRMYVCMYVCMCRRTCVRMTHVRVCGVCVCHFWQSKTMQHNEAKGTTSRQCLEWQASPPHHNQQPQTQTQTQTQSLDAKRP